MPMYPNNPETMMGKLDKLFSPYLQNNKIINCFIGILDPTNDIILCTNAGQPYPILYDTKLGAQEFVNLPSTSLGLGSKTENSYQKHEIQLRHKIFVLYSHGAEDLSAKNAKENDKNQFIKIVGNNLRNEGQNPAESIINSINDNTNLLPWNDDILVVTIQNSI